MGIGVPGCRRRVAQVVLLAVLTSSALVLSAPPGNADCAPGELLDPRTRMCWSQVPSGGAYGGVGVGPCEPSIGLCMGDISDFASGYTPLFIPPPMTDRADHG